MMIEVSAVQFLENPAYVQMLAEKEPVIVDNGTKKQVLMDYDEFINNAQANSQKSFVSLYDVFTNIPEDLQKALAELDDDIEEDFSFANLDSRG